MNSCTALLLALLSCLGGLAAAADPSAWESLDIKPACTARHETTAAAVNGKIYLFGGRGNKPVEEFDPVAKAWRTLGHPPLDLHHVQALTIDGRIAVVGALQGSYPKETPLADVWWFDPSTDAWTKGPALPQGRARGAAGAVYADGMIYLVGGNTSGHWNGFVPWLDALDVKTGTWTTLPDAPHARDHFQAVLIDGRIVAAGGRTTFAEQGHVFDLTVAEVDVFDLATRTWSTLPEKIPTPRAGCVAVAHEGQMIILGGESAAHPQAHQEVEALTLATGRWDRLPQLNQGRHGAGVALIHNDLFIVAGCGRRGGNPELNTVEWKRLLK